MKLYSRPRPFGVTQILDNLNLSKLTCLEPFHRNVRLAQRAWPCILENRDPFCLFW